MIIDIHSHILPFVDDGSQSVEQSLLMLQACIDNGVSIAVATPHHRFKYTATKQEILNAFDMLKKAVNDKGLDIELRLGQEIYVDREFKQRLLNQSFLGINGTKYLLIEFDLNFKQEIAETVYELKRLGYIPIVAHVERYFYADLEVCQEIKRYGGLIQINSGSIVGKSSHRYRKLLNKLFKYELVDLVASDVHFNRENNIKRAYERIQKKYGESTAKKVFFENAKDILKG